MNLDDLDDDEAGIPYYSDSGHGSNGINPTDFVSDGEVPTQLTIETTDDWVYADLFEGTNKVKIVNTDLPDPNPRWEDRKV
jgi:hypothetical protein